MIIRDALRHGEEIGVLEACKVLRRAFNRLAGRRDKCTQETAHLVSSTPVAICSHTFVLVNMLSKSRKINTDGADDDSATKDNIVDLYGKRMDDKC